eukprot:CAMPEP_0170556280 /NCGR_PEP_ID=MMETSP0211-20121228/16080_1 /TAXON_ID=311385 /ORGANISM="Pseudokeronopsis sp., Strain OXSARD2" /LENGTH=76 /DNA_ID=CAMNT_0010866519 /DNA_START=831 /DNA_END=1061 /DNA_ORIENTATION=-
MLHSFLILKPIIQEALENEERNIIRIGGRRMNDKEVEDIELKLNGVSESIDEAVDKIRGTLDSFVEMAGKKESKKK